MKPTRPRAWRWVFRAMACVSGVLVLGGCESSPPPEEGRIRIVDPGPMGDANARPTAAPVDWLSRRILIPLNQPIEEVWKLTDETVLPDVSRAVWNGNGIRVGLLSASEADAFGEALGKTLEVRDNHIRNFDEPGLLRRSPPLRAEFFADLTVPPLPVTKEYFTRGRLQLLMTSRPRGDGSALLTLLPQHHVPKSSFVPRTAAEKLLDGRIYDELGIELNIGPREALLIGFYQPPPAPATEEAPPTDPGELQVTPGDDGVESETSPPRLSLPPPTGESESSETPTEIEAEAAGTETEAATEDTPEVELNLGRGLFTTGATDRDGQILILIRPLP